MARPQKRGIDYFPVDVNILSDRKFRRARLKYGYLAFDVYFSLLCLIYKDKGYYIEYTEKTKDDVLWDILESLQGRYQPTVELIGEVIEELTACELFSGDLFRSRILTSERIQATYYKATVERKTIDINFGIWLLDETKMRALSEKSIILENFINRPKKQINRAENSINRTINPQSKENKSKLNNKPRQSAAESLCPFFERLWREYPRKKGKSAVTKKSLMRINKIGFEKMIGAVRRYGREVAGKDEQYILHGSTFFNGRYIDYLSRPCETQSARNLWVNYPRLGG